MLTLLFTYRSLILKAFILIVFIVSLFFNLYQHQKIKTLKIEYSNNIQTIELNHSNAKSSLESKLRIKEKELSDTLSKYQEEKEQRDEKIINLNSTIKSSNNRLQQLTKNVTEASRSSCKPSKTSSGTTQPDEGSRRATELTGQMANDFRNFSERCAVEYELLKSETQRLQDWSKEVESIVNK